MSKDQLHEEPHLDVTIDEDELVEGAKEIIKRIRPSWPMEQLSFKMFTNGLTNKLIGVWYPDHYTDMVLIRVYGPKTDLMINRKDETRNIRILNKAGYTHSIYATFNNGLAYQFLEGDTLTSETVRKPEVFSLIAERMAQMHRLAPDHEEMPKHAFIWEKIIKFMELMPKKFANAEKEKRFEKLIKPYAVLEQEYQFMKDNLIKLNSPVVYCHNDLLLTNILYNRKLNTVTFIDYEYTAYNYQAFDIANHFAEFAGVDVPDYTLYPEEKLQREWLKAYLQAYNKSNAVTECQITRLYVQVNKFLLLSHFLWGCWALIQSEHSNIDFDFLEYASIRFHEYFQKKENFHKLELCTKV